MPEVESLTYLAEIWSTEASAKELERSEEQS
jgi:hypothetical protein